MGKMCRLEVNGNSISARRGDLLLDAALLYGIDVPHDCRAGHCGTCRVRVLHGRVFGGRTDDPETVYACQSRVLSDLRVTVEEVPEVVAVRGIVTDVRRLAWDVYEVCAKTLGTVEYIPGQYYAVQFRGFPARCFSPTAPLDWPYDESVMRFHIRRLRDGQVSSALGERIRAGHRVNLEGPFGSAYLRSFPSRRLILVASGTGFAPIWSIAEAAIRRQPQREIVLIVGARTIESFYMVPALCRLAPFPRVKIVPVVSTQQDVSPVIRVGRLTDHLPVLTPHDVVFVAGAPEMVRTVAQVAGAAGAECYSDPFEPRDMGAPPSLWSRAASWLCSEPHIPSSSSLPREAATRFAKIDRRLAPVDAQRAHPRPAARH